jgi:hypothetical protein
MEARGSPKINQYSSAPSSSFSVRSIDNCKADCAQNPTCNIYTYNKSNGWCYLYPSADLVANKDYDSGVRQQAAEVKAPVEFTISPGVNATGPLITSKGTSTMNECLRQCRDTPDCHVFTFLAGLCWMYGRAAFTPTPGYVSGFSSGYGPSP